MSHPLSRPVGALMRAVPSIESADSLEVAARLLRESESGIAPVLNGPYLVGAVTHASLARAIAEGHGPKEPAGFAVVRVPAVQPYQSGADALRQMAEGRFGAMAVVDDMGRYMGLLSAADLFDRPMPRIRPPLIGGMATPFGVYLTTGSVRAGASDLALISTGATLFALFLVGQLAAYYGGVALVERGLPVYWGNMIAESVPLVLFLLGMRLLPLSGIHAAEHQVVHAIERGEPLEPEVVRRMPRVHPRCGTNIAVGAALCLGLFTSNWISPEPSVRLLVALLATIFFWRPLGAFVQYWITTRPPNDRQVQMGIRSGKELLERYASAHSAFANPFERIWASGMLHVMAGSFLCYGLVWLVAKLLGIELPI